jgi:hypothetical protein
LRSRAYAMGSNKDSLGRDDSFEVHEYGKRVSSHRG